MRSNAIAAIAWQPLTTLLTNSGERVEVIVGTEERVIKVRTVNRTAVECKRAMADMTQQIMIMIITTRRAGCDWEDDAVLVCGHRTESGRAVMGIHQ